jgi:hypothetical protein
LVQIQPDPGSSNPYTGPAGAGSAQQYTVSVVFGSKPATPAPDTIYTEVDPQSDPTAVFSLTYRIYVPADPESITGTAGLPSITWQASDGTVIDPGSACGISLPAPTAPNPQPANPDFVRESGPQGQTSSQQSAVHARIRQ